MSSKLLSRNLFLLIDIQNKINLILRTDSLDVKTFEKVLASKLSELVTFQEVTFTDKFSSQSVFLTNMKLNVLEKISSIEAKVNALTKLESIFLYSFNVTEGVMREVEANITNAVVYIRSHMLLVKHTFVINVNKILIFLVFFIKDYTYYAYCHH